MITVDQNTIQNTNDLKDGLNLDQKNPKNTRISVFLGNHHPMEVKI